MRHGARTPIDVYPTDPNKVEDWPSKPGTLTNEGLQQVSWVWWEEDGVGFKVGKVGFEAGWMGIEMGKFQVGFEVGMMGV